MENYYDILGIPKDASKADIKKAFRKLAHQYHPDKKGGDEQRFKKINEAYQTLSDDNKRTHYDTYGSAQGAGGPGGGDYSGFTNGAGGFDFSDIFRQGQAGGADFSDLFEGIFGGGGGGGQSRTRRGRDISIDIQIPFADAVFGTQRSILVNKVGTCDTCRGSGAKSGAKTIECKACGGKGMLRESRKSFMGTFTTERQCDICFGSGKVPEEKCPTCAGVGVLKKTEEVSLKIPAGIDDGEMIRLSGKGESIPHGTSGDLYVKMHVEKHPKFRRDGSNLVMDLPVKLSDALLGAEYAITTLDGEIKLKVPAGVSHGEILRMRGKGVPLDGSGRGDLLTRVIITIPTKLSRKALKLIEELKDEGI